MKKASSRLLSMLLATALILTLSAGIVPMHSHAASGFTTVGGWNENLYATISGISDSDVTAVSYSGAMSGSLSGQDLEYLVRESGNGVRIDIPGLKAGTYSLSVTTKSGEYAASNIQVAAHDRSGYAHWNYSQGIGAYNDDGTLKPGAIVLYVTDANKNSVTVTSKDGTTVTGIGNILNSGGGQYKVDSTTGLPIEHKLNTNQQILRRLADDGTPLVVRFIGRVTAPEGLTAYSSNDYGGTVGDNGFMARMQSGLNITLEGIGADAIIDGWGIHFIAQTSYPNYGKSFEARNIEFRNVPEDCLGMEGQQANGQLTAPVERCWVHHCSFYGPTISNPAESDKDGGDGAVDFKRGQYYTMSYCYFDGYHKTCLIGSTNSALQYHITWHHNHWKNCESRAPLTRQANVHIYNNVFENQSKDGMSLRANCFVYSEYNTYIDSVVNDEHNDGRAKCYNNKYLNSTVNTSNGALYNVTDRSETIDSKCTYANFDTNPEMGYVASGDYLLQPSTTYSCQAVMAYAGPMTEDASAPVLIYDEEPKPSYSGPPLTFTHNFTTDNLNSEFYTITGTLSTGKGSTSYDGNSLKQCLLVYDSAASVSFTAPYAGTLVMVFGGGTSDKGNKILVDGASRSIDANNQLVLELEAGEHTIKKGSDQVQLWYLDFTTFGSIDESHTHSYGASVVAPTCTAQGYTLYTCACGDSYKEAYVSATGHSYSSKVTAPTCTAQGYTTHTCSVCGSSYQDSYTAATGHSYADGVCQSCGAEDPGSHVHSHTAKITPPTCTAQGYTTHTCACGDSYVDSYVAATGHTEVTVAGYGATCTASGKTDGVNCSVCGAVLTAQQTIPASGHSYVGGACSVCGAKQPTASGNLIEAAGHLETAYVKWSSVSGATGYNVYVRKSGGSYVQLDTELIRKYPTYWRADALGLSAGSYTIKVVPLVDGAEQADLVIETGTLTVLPHDRNGFAHAGNYTVGAYNNNGTLSADAVVIYVTDANKNTLTAEIPGRGTATGLQSIITAAEDTTAPICIRIIGELDIPSKTSSGQIRIEGNAKGITVEGVGDDATCNGWGFVLSECENVEIRNLGFMNNDSSEGDSITLEDVTHAWVHNCDFFYGEPGSEADKIKGDGALDTKASRYITHSYNHFWDCGKVNLQGSSSGDSSNYITYHHNWYDHSDSRHPRVRNASVHVYNNYYDGNAGYGIGAACDSDVFVDSNYFRNCKYPMLISAQGSDTSKTMSGEPGGMIKAYGNVIVGATSYIPYASNSTSFDAYEVSNRSDTVPSSVTAANGGAGYNNFDTASSFYSGTIDTAQVGAEKAVAYAGRVGGGDFKWEFNDEVDDLSNDINTELKAALQAYKTQLVSIGGNSVITEEDPHTHSYASSVTKAATCTAAGVRTYSCSCGDSYTEAIAALGHSYADGVCSRCGAVESETPHTHSYASSVTKAATCTAAGVRTYSCSCGDSYTEEIPALGHSYANGKCSRCGAADPNYEAPVVPAGDYIHSFTDNALESSFYTFSGALATNKGKVSYNGATLTQCLVFDSSDDTISFTAPVAGTLTMVFGGSTSDKNNKILLNGTTYYIDANNQLIVDIPSGSMTVNKSDTVHIWYIAYVPSEEVPDVHTHEYTSAVTKAATCTADGVKTFTCSCGDSYTEAIAALGHTEVTVAGKAATCTEKGLTEGKKCSVCGEVTVAQTEIAAKGHSYSSSVTKVPDCTTTGVRTYTCSVCGDSYTEAIAATGHTEETVPGKAATCTETGLTDGKKCSVCGEVTVAQTETPALGHKFVDGICSVCGAADPDYVAGVTISGNYVSYGNASDVLTIQLIAEGESEAAYVFTNEAAPANTGSWSIEGVAQGKYTVQVMKQNHVTREYELTVTDGVAAVDVQICLLGDVDANGKVNYTDYINLLAQAKNPAEAILVGYARQCADITGEGNISYTDYVAVLSHAKGITSLW